MALLAAVFAAAVVAPPTHGQVADFNGDRRADILWYNVQTGALSEWLLDGHGNVTAFPL